MKLKDIVNRNLVNLINCEHEPIHIPGSIQPHGFLLALKVDDLVIDYCSGNCFEYIGMPYEYLIGKSFALVFGDSETKNLITHISSRDDTSTSPLNMKLVGKSFTCTMQKNGDIVLVEFETRSEEKIAITDIYRQTKQFTFYMQSARSLQMLCQSVADETRAITGYDRVMIYRFDKDYNGEVFAESKAESMEPFLGLHYPQTDIPVQARELYIKNMVRLIVDVNYIPVPVYTMDDVFNKNLDLSYSILRSVSPIHIQYLQNMGVAATLSISLIHDNRLWGLIACHHKSAKNISCDTRIAAQLQGHFLTSQISVRQLAEEYEVAKKVNKSLEDLLAQVFSSESIEFNQLIRQPELLSLTNAAGVIILVDGKIYSQGKVPPEKEIRSLADWLFIHHQQTALSTSNLSAVYPDAGRGCNSASGIIYQSLGGRPGNGIIWCRPEALQEVNWGGNPQTAITKD